MNNSRYFSPGRFSLVLKKDISAGYRSILLAASALAGVILIITVLSGFGSGGAKPHTGIWSGFLMMGGFIATSMVFREMHGKERGHDWHMLPASSMEKFISRLLLSSLGWAIGFTAIYWAASTLGEGLNRLIFDHGNIIFNPFGREALEIAGHYCILQSIFLLGAAYFRKAHFVKTVLFITVFNIVLGLLTMLLIKLFFWNVFTWDIFSDNGTPAVGWIDWNVVSIEAESLFLQIARVGKVIYFSVFAPILWIIAYFRVTEKEVRNGV